MNNKERLEEIMEDLTFLKGTGNKIVVLGISDYEYIIEQAERYDEALQDAVVLHKQNKRYREAITFALDHILHGASIEDVIIEPVAILTEALEVEQ